MSKGKIYEYAILHHPLPTKDQNERGESPKSVMLTPPTTVLATSDVQAATLAARAIPEQYLEKLDELEVVVRPF